MFSWWTPKPCPVCAIMSLRSQLLEGTIDTLKSQLAHSREREEKAVDALLERQGKPSITPQPRMSAKDSEQANRDVMGIFLDEDDKGDGGVLEVDKLNVQQIPG